MLVSVNWQAIASGVPAGTFLKVRAEAAARVWTDAEQADFARTFGIPDAGGLFVLADDISERSPNSPDMGFAELSENQPTKTPVGLLSQIGWISGAAVYIRSSDGEVWVSDPDCDTEYELANKDVSSLAYLLYMIEAEKPRPEERPDPYDWRDAEAIIREDITAWDPLPFADSGNFWDRYFDSYHLY